ncbi:MAG: DUF5615 family PIN-like protein [Planctomycetales bacterium]|nr:DUF5615 family PIN-like protein [Planctomycetales bacterium]MBN8626245.1 DUF5615 family PIN-like protein [Planctomycetota bacterium]
MTAIRLFTDEDIYGAVAGALRKRGFDAVSAPEANRIGESDEAQLEWCTAERRAIVTFNVGHFAALHSRRLQLGIEHAGIIVSGQRPIGGLIRRLLHLLAQCDAESLKNQLVFLNDW